MEVGLSQLNSLLSGIATQFGQLPADTTVDYPGVGMGAGDPMSGAFWAPTATGFRPISNIAMISPDGRIGVWNHAGRPLLWSKDLAAVKRVRRIAGKAASKLGGVRRSSRRGRR